MTDTGNSIVRPFGRLDPANSSSPLRASGAGRPLAEPAILQELHGFGRNPGNLRMHAYVPDRLALSPALVVAMHGCGQNANDYDKGAGWSTLADRFGFIVAYPEQQSSNNPRTCFSWFNPDDIARNQGEALSIREMAEHAIVKFGIDRSRVFVTGLSAGGAMTSVMLATYPEVFAGGAIIAGLPFGAAHSVHEALNAMFSDQAVAAPVLGDRVRTASEHRGPWPKISVWHGTADTIVKPSNAEHSVNQWIDVHGLTSEPSRSERSGGHVHRIWNGDDGCAVLESFTLQGMPHGVPLGLTTGVGSCGVAGQYFLDVGLCSTSHIAAAWGLNRERDGTQHSPSGGDTRLEYTRPDDRLAAMTAGHAAGKAGPAATTALDRRGSEPLLEANSVIAAAFKAAGLPGSVFTGHSISARGRIQAQAIIDSALLAAGLKRK